MGNDQRKLTPGTIVAGLLLAVVLVGGGIWAFTVYRTTATINKIVDKGEVILDKGGKVIEAAKEADYGKIKDTASDLADSTARKAGEITDKGTAKATETIGKLRDALKEKR